MSKFKESVPIPPSGRDAEQTQLWAQYFAAIERRAKEYKGGSLYHQVKDHCEMELQAAYMFSNVLDGSALRQHAAAEDFKQVKWSNE